MRSFRWWRWPRAVLAGNSFPCLVELNLFLCQHMKLIYWPNVHIELNQYLTNFTIYKTSFKIFTVNDSFPLKNFEFSFQIFLESFLFQNFKIFFFYLGGPSQQRCSNRFWLQRHGIQLPLLLWCETTTVALFMGWSGNRYFISKSILHLMWRLIRHVECVAWLHPWVLPDGYKY